MKNSTLITAAALIASAYGAVAFAQATVAPGNTGGGASTSSGAGIVTSGSAAPAGQIPRATDTTLGKQPGGTGAGMAPIPAGKSPAAAAKTADTKTATTPAKKKTTTTAKKKAVPKKKTDAVAS